MGSEKHVLPDTDDMLSSQVKKSMKEDTGTQHATIFGPDNRPVSVVDMEIGKELTNKKASKKRTPNSFGV